MARSKPQSWNFPVAPLLRIYQESVVHRFFGWIHIKKKYPFDDRVKDLQGKPLAMVFYNQRAMFFGLGLIFCVTLYVLNQKLPSNDEIRFTIKVLFVFWMIGAAITIALHPLFRLRLIQWSKSEAANEFPPMFDLYFLLDYTLIFSLVLFGKNAGLRFEAFTFLLFANTVVYSAYIRGSRDRPRLVAVILSLLVIVVLLFPGVNVSTSEPRWFFHILHVAPIWGTLIATVLLVSMISWQRQIDQELTQLRLELLGLYQNMVSGHFGAATPKPANEQFGLLEPQFEDYLTKMLEHLCQLRDPFWYDSVVVWWVERHQDRGNVLLPISSVNANELGVLSTGMELSSEALNGLEALFTPSIRHFEEKDKFPALELRKNDDIPFALVPLIRERRIIGALTIYGRTGGPPLQRQEKAFLNSLATIISNSKEQWDSRRRALSQGKMDDLFRSQSVQEVFHDAAKIMKNYLGATGCMVIFRRGPSELSMRTAAWEGLEQPDFALNYTVGIGFTGECAAIGETIRYDDVVRHHEDFDPDLLANLERAHGARVHSWMAIPIGAKNDNYGVIKVINRDSQRRWFTDEDQQIGENLALRLKVIIEKFLHLESVEAAVEESRRQSEEAKRQSEKATAERVRAQKTATQRQEDVMIMTHQLQAPLSSVIGAISNLKRKSTLKPAEHRLDYIHDLVEDGLNLCYGTSLTFALTTGRTASFDVVNIDATHELRMLCERLQKTNSRDDLSFVYHKDEGFPLLQMDRNVFTSVLYSLIHNAMKYADVRSTVNLMCTFERGKPALKVKTVGEPIGPNEVERIFHKFRRGRVVEMTGRHHIGVGLGLWVARELMRVSGGNLTVELSDDYPRVSVFVVHIPGAERA